MDMPRYILIDRNSGYVWGDSADFAAGKHDDLTPIEAAKLLDLSLNEARFAYETTERHNASAVYDVYRADVRGSEAVPVVTDGQDQETIDAVERECEYVTSLVRHTP
jgi:hypothetical protein